MPDGTRRASSGTAEWVACFLLWPPIVVSPDRPTIRQKIGSFVWGVLSLFLGWSLFIYWWWLILRRTTSATMLHLLTMLALIVALLLASSYLWIRHNKRLAARGRRGYATRFRVPIVEYDILKRPLRLPDHLVLRAAPILVITATDQLKTYTPAVPRP